ncbi:Calcium-transporting ATPase 10, plasma membrane-type, partial [Nowakowskiella sp. JEL0078]
MNLPNTVDSETSLSISNQESLLSLDFETESTQPLPATIVNQSKSNDLGSNGNILTAINNILEHELASKDHQFSRLAEIQEKYQLLAPDQFGLTPDEINKLCSFDNRANASQVQLLHIKYGGLEGIAFLLKSDLTKGLDLRCHFDIKFFENSQVSVAPTLTMRDKFHLGKRSDIKSQDSGGSHTKDQADMDVLSPPDMEVLDGNVRKQVFGSNIVPPPKTSTIVEIVWDTIKEDPIIKVLLVGAIVVISLGTAICPASGYIEGIAILVAVIIVLSVTAGNDWSKEKKFKKLLLLQSDKKTKVVRGGIKDQISSWDLVVGDIVEVIVGDEIPADGILVNSNRLIIDESPLTGESIPVKKSPNAPFLFSGTQVSEGSGFFIVTAVGSRSSAGQIQELLNAAQEVETVLQLKLKVVAVLIGKIGVAAGICTFIGLMIRWAIDWSKGLTPDVASCSTYGATANITLMRMQQLAEHFVIGITVVVVAVPEGLPLAVTISLAFSMFKMIKDKCFVRHLSASETMGEATCICTDKTGTLTENRMTVVKAMVGDTVFTGAGSGEANSFKFSTETLPSQMTELIGEAIAINSTCFIKYREKDKQPLFIGSATEGALLVFSKFLGIDYNTIRNKTSKPENGVWSFSSDRKRMSTLIQPLAQTPGPHMKYRLHTKGASEIVLDLCTDIVNTTNTATTPITGDISNRIQDTIKEWASEGLRTLALAYKDSPQQLTTLENHDDPEHDLVFLALVGIKDPVRMEVPLAVKRCQNAGLFVRMVTGDNVLTANKIARECGILTDGISMEGPDFRELSDEEKRDVVPRLQVLARSSPADKFALVKLLKDMGEVVAVTGDGTNDAPALKEADVGFAMGVSGTQIAMNASDIILMDDNFVSLVQSIRWGRNVLSCVRKFLQFQLAVNLVAIIITFVGSMINAESPLSTVQLLWVNLIMDSLGALALASDEPEIDILEKPPHSRKGSMLSPRMIEYILTQLVYQTTVLLVILIRGTSTSHFLPYDPIYAPIEGTTEYESWAKLRTKTIVFTAFILMQISNETMARQLDGELNPFKGIFRNKLFLLIMAIIIGIQILVVMFGQNFVQTTALDWE